MPPRARTTPAGPWPALIGDDGPPCGYTHDDHVHDGETLTCVRAEGHPGPEDMPARDMHLARLDGEPVFFGDPIAIDPEEAP